MLSGGALSGCSTVDSLITTGDKILTPSPMTTAYMAIGTGLTLNMFEKTPIDMAVSALRDEDCSVLNIEKGKAYCKDPTAKSIYFQAPVYCYRRLGDVECLAVPDNNATRAPLGQSIYLGQGY